MNHGKSAGKSGGFAVAFALLTSVLLAAAETPTNRTGWWTVGAMAPVWDGHMLEAHSDEGTLAVTPLSADVIRVRFAPGRPFGRDHSYAVVNRDLGKPAVKVETGANRTTLVTESLRVTVQHSPLRISFADAAGNLLDQDDPERGIAVAGTAFRVAKELRDDDHVYGFGEKNGKLDKRGWQLGGYNLVMWNADTYSHDSSTDPIYVSVPFYMVLRNTPVAGETARTNRHAYGVFLDNTWRSSFDVGREAAQLLTFGAVNGDLDYYFINGPDPKAVIGRYTALTGHMPLPPLWSLGYNQCRYSYYPEARVREIARTFREKKIPCDVVWLDIHYQDNYKPFTWNHERFPDPKKMIADLRAEGYRVVNIVDAHPKKEKGSAPYDSGMAGDFFVKNPDGSVYEGEVWPAHAEHNPGPSVFPDFSKPAARDWWGGLFKDFVDTGLAGIWNDMNEPAVFGPPRATMPPDVVFDNEGQPSTHLELHNVFGQLMSRATFEGLSKLRPNDRAFVLTRASYAGGQKYAAVWTGDNASDWTSLRQAIPTLLGLGLSGFPFVGSDIGGFAGMPSGELYTRWMQSGVFSPFMRGHSEFGRPDKEPWVFGARYEAANRRAIELRYELLPYIYNVMQQASETGVPALRPLFLNYPDDKNVTGTDDEFLFGDDLLAAPVLVEGATNRSVYLPKGEWYDYWTGRHYRGGEGIRVPVALESMPLFVRGGGFIFRQPVVQNTVEMPGKPLRVLVAPAADSTASLYEDDGETLDYRQGKFMKRSFHQTRTGQELTVEVGAPEGSYRPAARDLVLETWADQQPKAVTVRYGNQESHALPYLKAAKLADAHAGWSYEHGVVTVKDSDHFEPANFGLKLQ